ncbi:hypothetical protein ACFL0F_01775 [Patescibacteria group bacterium]
MRKFTALILVLLCSLAFSKPSISKAETLPLSQEVTVSASIGEPRLRLWGYAPSNTNVSLNGIGISDVTVAAKDGYFEFNKVFLPIPSLSEEDKAFVYPEICLQAMDAPNITTQPTCIPPLPFGDYDYDIGPVVLSPTFIIEKGSLYEKEQVKASGKTTPNTEVNMYLAREESGSSFFTIVKETFAYNIPTYQITSDENGYYEFNLPSDSTDKWRVFATSKVLENNSPKSNTISYNVLPQYLSLLTFFSYLFSLIKPYLLFILVLLQIAIILLLFYYIKYRDRKKKHVHRPIIDPSHT